MRMFDNPRFILGTFVAVVLAGILFYAPLAVVRGQDIIDKTGVFAERTYTINSTDPAANPSLDQLDVSLARTIRINFRTGNCTSCSPVRVDVLSNSTVIDTFNIDVNVNATRVYEIPGTQLSLKFAGSIAGASNGVTVTVLGRAN